MKLAMIFWRIALIVILVVAVLAPYGYADEIPKGWEASNMKPIGYSDWPAAAAHLRWRSGR